MTNIFQIQEDSGSMSTTSNYRKHPAKKLVCLLLTLTLLLTLSAAAFAAGTHEISDGAFPLYANSMNTGMEMKLYFLDGVGDLPYMEVNDLVTLLRMFFESEFAVSAEDAVVTITRTNEAYSAEVPMTIDFDSSVLWFQDYNLFCMLPVAPNILDLTMSKGFNDNGEPAVLQKVGTKSFERFGDAVEIRLGDYGIDLVRQDGLYLIPLQTVSDFFTAPNLAQSFYFNGQSVIFSGDLRACPDVYYSAPAGERSEELTEFGFNELCVMLDCLYGLKEAHAIDSFGGLFHEVGFDAYLRGPEVKQADGAIYRLITDFLDDNHSKFYAFSYLTGPNDYQAEGFSRTRMAEHRQRQMDARAAVYPDGIPGYEEVGNTAYISFDSFNMNTDDPDVYYRAEDVADLPDDTVGLIMKAHAMINREDSPIENIVLDLSANGGGATDAAVFTIAWFLGEAAIGMNDTMTGAMCSTTYRGDTNRDRQFDESDAVTDKNLFCLISPFSFSGGNLVPCMLKESGKVTLLGRTSGGGACVVQPVSSAWGTSFAISGPRRMSFLKNGAFYDVDRGADPDFVLPTPAQYYDRAALTDYLNSICWKAA